jgi:hypothetical protein
MTNADILRPVSKPPMVMRSIRVPLKLWQAAKDLADERQENISDVVRDALERYVKRGKR